MRIIIVGCGEVGSRLAASLASEGHQVVVVDRNRQAFTRLPKDFPGEALVGTGIDDDVLRRAGVEQADAFIAATEFDNTNLVAAQVARERFHVPRAVARVYDLKRDTVFREFGLTTVCPTAATITMIRDALDLGGGGKA